MIFLQLNKIQDAMAMDKKDPFQRLSKLLEEQGEMVEAYFDKKDYIDTIEEAIDNLLVSSSIAYVIDHDSLIQMESIFNSSIKDEGIYSVEKELINFIIQTGKISDIVQKYLKVGASCYKGSVTKEETINEIKLGIVILSKIIKRLVVREEFELISYVNSIINKKNNKWMEKSILGNIKQVS